MKKIELSWGSRLNRYTKSYEVSKDGRIIIYPSLYEIKESKLGRLLKKILHVKKEQ
ncbi:MAG: hypothetical protein ABSA46_00800 [Thermodesulfovibrionales bacterium]